jgi:hypothetical protein
MSRRLVGMRVNPPRSMFVGGGVRVADGKAYRAARLAHVGGEAGVDFTACDLTRQLERRPPPAVGSRGTGAAGANRTFPRAT